MARFPSPRRKDAASAFAHAERALIPLGTYAPTWVEIVVVIGVVSLGALAFLVLAQKLLPGRAAPRDAEAAAVERPAGEAA